MNRAGSCRYSGLQSFTSLKAFCDQDAARSAHGGLSVLAFDASEKLYDVPPEFCIGDDLPNEPLQLNCLVGKYRPAIAYPELKTDHRPFGGEVRCGQSEKKRGSVRSAGDAPAVPLRRREVAVLGHLIGVADRVGIVVN